MRRVLGIPDDISSKLEKGLAAEGRPLSKASDRAHEILGVSDHFLNAPADATPWEKPFALGGYLSYFFPLNLARLRAVVAAGTSRGFFDGLETSVDWGAGPATATIALAGIGRLREHWLIERSEVPRRFADAHFATPNSNWFWSRELPKKFAKPEKTLGVLSYSLTETSGLPPGFESFEALMIVEPSTQDDGRHLLERRRELLAKGFHAWAPCPHQGPCPLLEQSPRDWCHDRVFFQAPSWFAPIEAHLPMKNQTLTFSYLLLRKTPPPSLEANVGRLIGDTLREKGKDRQMICRGPKREFLAWMHRDWTTQDGEAPELPRGSLVEIPASTIEKSNELRVKDPIKVLDAAYAGSSEIR